jgi:hypothetical protein
VLLLQRLDRTENLSHIKEKGLDTWENMLEEKQVKLQLAKKNKYDKVKER